MKGFGYRLSKEQVKRFKLAKKIMGSNLDCKFDMRNYIHIADSTKLNSINTQAMYDKTKDETGHENMNHFLNSYDKRWLEEATIADIMHDSGNVEHN